MISADFAALLYLVSGVLFILALRGLSSPASARSGNSYGMVGMAIAIVTTLLVANVSDWVSWVLIIGGLGLGGGIGAYMARTVKMTDMPQLVAAFHSLVGAAAVLVAVAAFYSPASFGIGVPGAIKLGSLIEMGLGTAIGAITAVFDNLARLSTYAATFAAVMAGRWVAGLAAAALSVTRQGVHV